MLLHNIIWIGIGSIVLTLIVGLCARTPWFFAIDDDDERQLREAKLRRLTNVTDRAWPTIQDFPLESEEPSDRLRS